jgi:hypothetical protein
VSMLGHAKFVELFSNKASKKDITKGSFSLYPLRRMIQYKEHRHT